MNNENRKNKTTYNVDNDKQTILNKQNRLEHNVVFSNDNTKWQIY